MFSLNRQPSIAKKPNLKKVQKSLLNLSQIQSHNAQCNSVGRGSSQIRPSPHLRLASSRFAGFDGFFAASLIFLWGRDFLFHYHFYSRGDFSVLEGLPPRAAFFRDFFLQAGSIASLSGPVVFSGTGASRQSARADRARIFPPPAFFPYQY